jgi:hypothetical protein
MLEAGALGAKGALGVRAGAGAGAAAGAETGAAGAVVRAAGAAGAAPLAVSLLTPLPALLPPRSSAGNVSLMVRTTGGSMVDDADRTNSPLSLR